MIAAVMWGDVFRRAIQAFDEISTRAVIDPTVLANRVWEAACDNGYDEFDGIIEHVEPALEPEGFGQFKLLVASYAETPLDLAEDDHEALQFCVRCAARQMIITPIKRSPA